MCYSHLKSFENEYLAFVDQIFKSATVYMFDDERLDDAQKKGITLARKNRRSIDEVRRRAICTP